MPRARARALVGLAGAMDRGDVVVDRGADRSAVRSALLDLPGIGPWTASYVAMRALGDPDAFLPTDLGVKHALTALGAPASASDAWRPWRSYALMHLWTSLGDRA
jgi:AraC family transcriptional regulator of adaptative response / DNA-3-methyladenine glycosylase II